MKIWLITIPAMVIAFSGGIVLNDREWHSEVASEPKVAEAPLYWRAPMNPNFRSDKPGKSPMGMDLIPVYAAEQQKQQEAGIVTITPAVENNLGVRTAEVKRGQLVQQIETVGYVGYDENKLTQVNTRVDGWIEKLYVTAEGDPVKRGQRLFELYSPTLVNAQEEYLAALKSRNKGLLRASKARLSALGISAKAVQRLEQTLKVKQRISIYAPQDGYVANLNVRQGMYIKPSVTVMKLVQLDSVWVMAEVFERQAGWLKEGQPATMTLDYLAGREWLGKVDYVYPTLDSKTRTLRVRIRFENNDGMLKPNMFTRIAIQSRGKDNILMIPREAVIRTGNQNRVVKALGEGRFKSVRVKTGLETPEHMEILRGLRAGEQIVTSAQFLIDSESSVTRDFERMNFDDGQQKVVIVEGRVNTVMVEHRMLTVAHQPVDIWQWPSMTMNFTVDTNVDLALISEGDELRFELRDMGEQKYQISKILDHRHEEKSAAAHQHESATDYPAPDTVSSRNLEGSHTGMLMGSDSSEAAPTHSSMQGGSK
ncbi:efflux RND transporter periplasmic adaptor subunit [Motiliproteus sp. MSK22-1]|uniref:efflux RND transporter periplasmic adaptor subunit n=1 Tax=Motiliproteus sp. MSK22-1 TaxID=1897630 RepID=UPI000975B90F|nr:efflux RND transporter periplasmic adaptor subunit [Motiliproteus sp. MSK22-1]OMH31787.1 hypothetical protein BGP75_16870 [Motiliproteus sp. MSK22-1]